MRDVEGKESKKLSVGNQASLGPFLENDSDFFFLSSPFMVDGIDCRIGGQLHRWHTANSCKVSHADVCSVSRAVPGIVGGRSSLRS